MRSILIALAVLCFAGAAFAAAPFADVPANHWAYDAIQKCVDAGILQGFDGQFHGKKLLNRYQVAVIVAKMLDRQTGKPIAGKDGKGVENIEALTIEFADELALLNVKVSTLEDSFVELKNDVEKMKGGRVAVGGEAPAGGMGFSCFASFGLVMADDYQTVGGGTAAGFTPFLGEADTNFFTDPIIGLGAQKDLGSGVGFNLRLYSNTHVDGGGGVVEVEHAYFHMDEFLGKNVAGNLGGFTLEKLSLEHNGAFGTCDMSITPSFLNYGWRTTHVYGIDFMNKPKKAEDIQFGLALLSGTDGGVANMGSPAAGYYMIGLGLDEWNSLVGSTTEGDDGFGYLLFVKKPIATSKLGWNFAWYSNGGDISAAAPATPSLEVDVMQLGIDWAATKDLGVYLQYAQTDVAYATATPEASLNMWFLMLNYKFDAKQSLTLRYETDTANSEAPGAVDAELKTITFAYNRKVTDNSMFQFEYLAPDFDVATPGDDDVNDDMIQFRTGPRKRLYRN